jgi:hypothetical protein
MLAAIALLATAPAAYAAYPGGNGRITFVQEGGVIASFKPDGSDYQVHVTGTDPAWSPTGDKLAFVTRVPNAVSVVNADGTGRKNVTQRGQLRAPTWSPDGKQLAVVWWAEGVDCHGIAVTRLDGTESRIITPPPDRASKCADDLQWSPNGDRIAFSASTRDAVGNTGPREIFTIEPDGTDLVQVTNEELHATDPEWSPDGSRIAYDITDEFDDECCGQQVFSIRSDGTDRKFVGQGRDPAWSPDGSEIAMVVFLSTTSFRIEVVRTNHNSSRSIMHVSRYKGNLDWQRVDPGFTGHPRPKSATGADITLVPTFAPCSQPNREHGPPLAFGSCSPPAQQSSYLTVGTPDANGLASRFAGKVSYAIIPGNPTTPADEAEVRLTATLTDVLCRVDGPACTADALSDFSGRVRLQFAVRITDKYNALGHSITMQSTALSVDIPCSVTPATTAGSDCDTATTLDALVPGIVPEGKRSNWELEGIVVYDGGPSGDHSTGSPTPFLVPGVWVP